MALSVRVICCFVVVGAGAGSLPSEAARDLIAEMLRPEPADRIELPDVLMHPWLSGGARLPATLPVSVLQAAPVEAAAFVAPELPPGAVQGNVLMDPASPGTLRLSIRFVRIAVIVAVRAWSH